MTRASALVLKAPGTNCDFETIDVFERVGASAELVTTHDLFRDPERLLRSLASPYSTGPETWWA